MSQSKFSRLFADWTESIDKSIGWSKLPTPLALPVLIGLRDRLRAENLYDTGRGPLDKPPFTDPNQADYRGARTLDGTYNDLGDPLMGAIGSRFGRNVPLDHSWQEEPPELLDPNPRLISRKLLTRETFQPATTLNLLAGAWIQFEVHDWFSHGDNDPNDRWEIPLEDDDPWPDHPMGVDKTLSDPSTEPGKPKTFVTKDTHWWDGSQVYGSTPEFAEALRTHDGGKLKIDAEGLPPKELEAHIDFRGVAGNFWIGLALLHSLFMREHNVVCDRLHAAYPELTDQKLYEKARLVVAALMAKIHTVDWTPAIIAHPTTVLALRTNWYGLLGEHFDKLFGRVTKNEVIRGIPGSPTNHHGVPYSLTEEFVAVYRMHPLIPDEFVFRSLRDDSLLQRRELPEVGALEVRNRLSEMSMVDVFYSFGRSHPGAITLHNYPRFLQDFHRPAGDHVDLASIDVLRVRERGVPRYNEFRRLFHLNPVSSFEELTDNPVWAEELRRIYGDVERVDLMIGMYAEPKPKGFGFSDTAFRVFILMASRRLESDRFFTADYRPEVYTQVGFDWVESNTMHSLLLRHFPELAPALEGVANPFAPWTAVGGAAGLADRLELTRARVGLERLDALDDLWTDYLERADVGDVARERDELLALAGSLIEAIDDSQAGVERLLLVYHSFTDADVDAAVGRIAERHPQVVDSFRSTLAEVLEEYSVRDFITDAYGYLLDELPRARAELDAKRARIEAGEFQPGDLPLGVKCAANVALLGVGIADIVVTGGAVTAIGLHAAQQMFGVVLSWEDCAGVAKRIWRRLRR